MNAFIRIALSLVILAAGNAAPTHAAPLILNEFNAVSGSNFLNFGTATTDGDGNSINPPADTYFGRIAGKAAAGADPVG